MIIFMSYDNALAASKQVVGLLRTEGYKIEYLKVEIVKNKNGFFIEASSEMDPLMAGRFRHLLKEYTKTYRKYISI
ncbi:hypothetical protein A2425_02810 [candidate division WWE3 bacterium RIFOXYC1_FULL_42_17]|uniref:Uncharacterized protein n=2 Tax=Katanobacteria TaxID=422282 RepID=A0A1F4W3L0_UNCKA|nr:MAG: hypothetical protein UU86_C0001G0003 [candidate division WWE3 bacterium GW2011_GWC1_42_102]OGC63999.1 MAG: hypothetical protein A2399_01535 [candidate division WWE3 bacterium RIFOXYB1_FULL_42_27]OGC72119.1 MAG: hypothetical protein A2578_01345 [candidate division WWE3 bacterium RIFOXYD1_FULL_42_24]OGC74420.1 MAG: hypothetical protein A2425_02810 [candidate division WWE3 bacterium RIFOXYC1_FULL_42_17]